MRDCTNCKYAEWKKTAQGRLHPDGTGRCKYPWTLKPLPASMYWVSGTPSPCGGYINRREYLSDHCAYYATN